MTARVVLRISAPDLDPEHVTRATGLSPTSVQRRGEPQRFASGIVHGEGAWQLKSAGTGAVADALRLAPGT